MDKTPTLLSVRDLRIGFGDPAAPNVAVDGVSFDIAAGASVALVGASGSGKTVTALSLSRLLPSPPALYLGGEVRFAGLDLMRATERDLMAVRGAKIAYVFQEPAAALNPVIRIGEQVAEVVRLHRPGVPSRPEFDRLCGLVGLPDSARLYVAYPHELSGGMQQRIMVAMALAGEPQLLVADEPTTALDVTVQAQILVLLRGLQRRLGMALLLITHNLAIVAELVDTVHVMQAGRIVESGPVERILAASEHPYTRALLAAVPRLREPLQETDTGIPQP
jgi:ABC-type dipeptide/oligopeptide/nickel transport system ATPase component